jgi:heme-degrading monooxygenase HmoA
MKPWARRCRCWATLLRSHSPHADFRFAELAADTAPEPSLPARAHGAVYDPVVDDLEGGVDGHACVLVNPFEVPPDADEAFIAAWIGVRDRVVGRDGYVGSRLHRSRDPRARFRFVNVAPWRDVDAFTAAVADPGFAEAARAIYHRAHPSLFEPFL